MKRLSFIYLTLVVAAFMVGLGNVWKFPIMVVEYGLGGLAVYLLSVALLTGMLATAVKTTQMKEYGIAEYFHREFGEPAFALLFMIFDVILLGYYSIIGGRILSVMAGPAVVGNMLWDIVMGVLFLLLVLIILVFGKERTMDFMAVSFLLFLAALSIVVWGMYSESNAGFMDSLRNILVWKGLTIKISLDMASQAAYSLGLGMGFYLLLGAVLPRNISGTGIVVAGAVMDTLVAIGGLLLVAEVMAIAPSSHTGSFLFTGLPELIMERFGVWMFYAFGISLFLAAITSMIPIGEVTGKIAGELFGFSRGEGITLSIALALSMGIIVALVEWLGFDSIGVLDGAVSTFILFGGIIEAYAAIGRREYLPRWLLIWAWMGIPLAALLGLYAFLSWNSILEPGILLALSFFALSLNGRLKRNLRLMWKVPHGR